MYDYMVFVIVEYILVVILFIVNMFLKKKNIEYFLENSYYYSEENEFWLNMNMKNIKNMGYLISIFVYVFLFVLVILVCFVYVYNIDSILVLWEILVII